MRRTNIAYDCGTNRGPRKMIVIHNVTDLDLAQTLDCGQAFRWRECPDGSYEGTACGVGAVLTMDGSSLKIECVGEENEDDWRHYLDLDFPYAQVREELSKRHTVLKEAAEYASGIRILNQEPWETLCSFIISQNNNIRRIKGIVERLCGMFGERKDGVCLFPTPEELAGRRISEISEARAGFRTKYILDAARKVASGEVDLSSIAEMPVYDARHTLMKISGVGPKVAECALLYGFHRLECFPMDVWMKRAMAELFPGMAPADFGEYAGIAQQYIFHYSRMHPELFG